MQALAPPLAVTDPSARARRNSSRFSTSALCLLTGSQARDFASRLAAPLRAYVDRLVFTRARIAVWRAVAVAGVHLAAVMLSLACGQPADGPADAQTAAEVTDQTSMEAAVSDIADADSGGADQAAEVGQAAAVELSTPTGNDGDTAPRSAGDGTPCAGSDAVLDDAGPADAQIDAGQDLADAGANLTELADTTDIAIDATTAYDTGDALAAQCTPTACDDGQVCTQDLCDAAGTACVHVPVTGPCAAGAGVCVLGKCCMPMCTAGPCSADGCAGLCPCPPSQVCHAGACIADPEWSDWPAPPDAPTAYTVTDDVVIDLVTKLTWQRAAMAAPLTWSAGIAACDALTLGGSSDWRLPTATELFSIVDLTRLAPAIEPTAFPDTAAAPFWSASPHAKMVGLAWAVDFTNGRIDFGHYSTWQARRVRCVRSPVKAPGGKG